MNIKSSFQFVFEKVGQLFKVDNKVQFSRYNSIKTLLNEVYNITPNVKHLLEKVEQESRMLEQDYNYYLDKHRQQQSYSIYNLCSDLKEQVKDEFFDIMEANYPSDRLGEIADSWIPIYNWELAQYLANDLSLSEVDDMGGVEGVTCIFKIIQWSIYEHLSSAAYEAIEEVKKEKLEFFEHLLNRWTEYKDRLEELKEELEEEREQELIARIEIAEQKIEKLEELIELCEKDV